MKYYQTVAVVLNVLTKTLSKVLKKGCDFKIRIDGSHSKVKVFDITEKEGGETKYEDLRDERLRLRRK